jgi:hypothetical protein
LARNLIPGDTTIRTIKPDDPRKLVREGLDPSNPQGGFNRMGILEDHPLARVADGTFVEIGNEVHNHAAASRKGKLEGHGGNFNQR